MLDGNYWYSDTLPMRSASKRAQELWRKQLEVQEQETEVVELEENGVHQFPRELPVELELWNFLEKQTSYPTTGRRTSMVRFGAPVA